MQTAITILVLIAALALFIYLTKKKLKNTPMIDNHPNVLTLTDKNFEHQIKNKLVLVDFWASWCAPCRMMAPILNEVAAELSEGVHIAKVDIEQYQSLAQKYSVRSIPTLILFKNGKEINRYVGVKNKDFLIKQFDLNK